MSEPSANLSEEQAANEPQKRDYPRCATCKRWFGNEHRWGWCDMFFHRARRQAPPMAYTDDEDDRVVPVITSPDFGCIQHEPR